MRDLLILLVHLITTTARLMGPGGARSVIAESLLVKHQLLILNRSRQRAPNLRASDRLLAGVCSLFITPDPRGPLGHRAQTVNESWTSIGTCGHASTADCSHRRAAADPVPRVRPESWWSPLSK